MKNIILKNNKISWKDYFLMFIILTTSANIFVGQNIEIFIIIGLFFIFIYYPDSIKIKNKEIILFLIILFFISFEFIHRIIFNLHNTKTIIRILGYYLFAYFSVKALNKKFVNIYINLIFYLAFISIIFYVISLIPKINILFYNLADTLFKVIPDYNNYHKPTLIIFTFSPEYIEKGIMPLRNAGFAWEAGAFGFFLNLAIYLYIARNKISIKLLLRDKKVSIMLIALLLTFSTTTYIVFWIYIIFFIFNREDIKKYFLLIIFGLVFFYAFNNLFFLKEKINFQIKKANISQNRFGAAILDWYDIKKKPFLGWSRKEKVLFGSYAGTRISHRPNGLTNKIRKYGFINFFVLIFLIFYSFKKYFLFIKIKNPNKFALFGLIIILVSSFSELLLEKEIIKTLLFLFYVYKS